MITWTHVNEALPDDDATMLLARADGEVSFGYHDVGAWKSVHDVVLHGPNLPTHWAPVPAGPADVRTIPITRIDPHHAKVRLLLNEITGAGVAVLHAINNAGGHVITGQPHQAAIGKALHALERRVQEALDLPAILED